MCTGRQRGAHTSDPQARFGGHHRSADHFPLAIAVIAGPAPRGAVTLVASDNAKLSGSASVVVVHDGRDRTLAERPGDDRLDPLPLPAGKATPDPGHMHGSLQTGGMVGDFTQTPLDGVIANRRS